MTLISCGHSYGSIAIAVHEFSSVGDTRLAPRSIGEREHRNRARWSRAEGVWRYVPAEGRVEAAVPTIDVGAAPGAPPHCDMCGHDQLRPHQSTGVGQQSTQNGCRRREGQIGDDAERLCRKAQGGHVGVDHANRRAAISLTQRCDSVGMELDGDDSSAGTKQMVGDRTIARTEVENELAGLDVGSPHEPSGPLVRESVKAPVRPLLRGHGGSSQSSSRRR